MIKIKKRSLLPIVCDTKLKKWAKLSTPEKKNISETSKHLQKSRGLQIMPSPTITQPTDFKNASLVDEDGFITRKTLEAWHTKLTSNVDNNSYCHHHMDNITYFLTNIHNNLHSY